MSSVKAVDQTQIDNFRDDFENLRREIAKVVVGQSDIVDGVLSAAVAGGHVLVEGVPGLGKTLLIETLSEVIHLSFQRVQFTPDLMPSDLLGTHVIMETPQGRRVFEFQEGPIFVNLVLADQINRGMPKTQSALLQAMEAGEISVAHETFHLPQPFFVMATQNPQEMEGTFPLPEPEIDRFFFKLLAGPPTCQEVEEILERTTEGEPPEVRHMINGERLLEMRHVARAVTIAPELRRLAVTLMAATHPDFAQAPDVVKQFVRYGSSPRGAQALVLGAKIRAAAAGRLQLELTDLRAVAYPALRHRMILNFEGQAEDVRPDRLVDRILETCCGKEG
ncbi:MAG: MoxR family ATPase [Thermoguttaceae bacterium]|jgi:MoxR-like ATPase